VFTPAADYNGPASFTYTVSDGAASATATVSGTVTPVNDAPVASADPVTTPVDTPIGGTVVAHDVDGDDLTYTLVENPAHGVVTMGEDGHYVYTPSSGFAGDDVFYVRVDDGAGGVTLARVLVHVESSRTVNAPSIGALDLPDPEKRPTQSSALSVEGIVVDTVDRINTMRSMGALKANGVVLRVVNDLQGLNGLALADVAREHGHSIEIETSEGSFDQQAAHAFLGHAARLPLFDARERIDARLETIVRPDSIAITIVDANKLTKFELLSRDGSPAPAWLERQSNDLYVGKPPAGKTSIELMVRMFRSDGGVVERPVTIDMRSGVITPIAPKAGQGALFIDQLERLRRPEIAAAETATLESALGL
jgi:hypothetical protein